jgi:integrase
MDTLGHVLITDINAEFLEILRETRAAELNQRGEPVTASTIQKDFIFISGVLEYARETLKAIFRVPKKLSFTGKFAVRRRGRSFLNEAEYQTLHQAAKAQCDVEGLNPRTKRQREHLYWFILISVGGALRVGEAHSVRWCDCELLELQIPNGTTQEAVRMMVLGKHSKTKGGVREDAYVLFGGVFAYKQMLAARPAHGAPEDLLFPESNREGMKRLLKELDLYEYRVPTSDETMTRDRKSLRPTGITLRLDKGDNLSYRDVAHWARTSVQTISAYYDQATPESSAVRVATFKTSEAYAPPTKHRKSSVIRT